MPLPPPTERERLHTRAYDYGGYRRADGLWDIEGRMTDAKTYGFDNAYRGHIEAGEPLHDMWIRLTVDEDLVVRAIEVATEAGPYAVCPAIAPNFQRMVGVKVGPGWRQSVRSKLGGIEGCTHLVEMLVAMATVTFQTLYPVLAKKAAETPRSQTGGRRPGLIDSCHAYRADGEVVNQAWPEHYTGD